MNLQEALMLVNEHIPEIDEDRNYWFVRTQGGEYYDEFIQYGFIAIGYNEVSLQDINTAHKNGIQAKEVLSERIKKIYGEDEVRPGLVASQLLRFSYDIKAGDVIIVPSYGSHDLSFGIVKEDMVTLVNPAKIENACPYKKRKKVKWIKTLNRYSVDSKLLSLIYTHQTISDANEYAPFIDRELNSFFRKGDKTHLVLKVETEGKISGIDWANFWASLHLANNILEDANIDEDTSNVEAKVNVQSLGVIELTAIGTLAIIALGFIFVGFAGGGGTFKIKDAQGTKEASIKTDGIIEKITKAINSKETNKALAKMVENADKNLQIKQPEDLLKILQKYIDNNKK